MHEPVAERIEEYLQGTRMPDVDEHLLHCESCRSELSQMKLHSQLLRSLRAPQELEIPAAFYARLMNRIDSQSRQSVWSVFSESIFAKRLAYASATFLLLLGTYFVSTNESGQPLTASAPEVIMANDGHVHGAHVNVEAASAAEQDKNRDSVFVNLATYHEQ
jgi:predicted anti-sigma-YlaC factor YlaD